MPPRGRPTEERRARGKPPPDPTPELVPPPPLAAPPAPKPARRPEVPVWLTDEGRAKFAQVVDLMAEAGTFKGSDVEAVGQFCDLWVRWRDALKKIDETDGPVITAPNQYKQKNPWVELAITYQKDIKVYLDILGLTPKARARLKIQPDKGDDDGKFTEFE